MSSKREEEDVERRRGRRERERRERERERRKREEERKERGASMKTAWLLQRKSVRDEISPIFPTCVKVGSAPLLRNDLRKVGEKQIWIERISDKVVGMGLRST